LEVLRGSRKKLDMEDLYSADDNASSTIDPDLKAKLDRDALNVSFKILLAVRQVFPTAHLFL
jgi:hypothetical protein